MVGNGMEYTYTKTHIDGDVTLYYGCCIGVEIGQTRTPHNDVDDEDILRSYDPLGFTY
jgi:hypothetical protein